MADTTIQTPFNHADYAGFWVRFFAACIDLIVYLPFYYGVKAVFPQGYDWYAETVFGVFALITYAMFFASRMKGSPGMYLLRFHICKADGSRVSLSRALFWGITSTIGMLICCAGVVYLQSRFDLNAVQDLLISCRAENLTEADCAREIETVVNIPYQNFVEIYYAAAGLAVFLLIIWALSIALPKDKIGFHNLICQTRFVKGRG